MPNTWPTLATPVWWEDFEEDILEDPTVRTMLADGRPLARSGPTPVLSVYRYVLRMLSAADKTSLQTFQNTTVQVGGETFTWTDPRTGGSSHTVRLREPMKFLQDRAPDTYRTIVSLVEEPDY